MAFRQEVYIGVPAGVMLLWLGGSAVKTIGILDVVIYGVWHRGTKHLHRIHRR